MIMSKEAIRLCIKRKELCDVPELNKRLYLHNKGFSEIKNIEEFTEVQVLFLEGNALTKIGKADLNAQVHLESLHLQKNKLVMIENLDSCVALKFLDLSNNQISQIENLSSLDNLESLVINNNKLMNPESIGHLIDIKKLRELDLADNNINCPLEGILEILSQCKSLKVLSLKGNGPDKGTKHYRKLVISRCHKLTQFDDKAICTEERRRCNAWGKVVMEGGSFDEADEADHQELNNIRAEKSEANTLSRTLKDAHIRDDVSEAR